MTEAAHPHPPHSCPKAQFATPAEVTHPGGGRPQGTSKDPKVEPTCPTRRSWTRRQRLRRAASRTRSSTCWREYRTGPAVLLVVHLVLPHIYWQCPAVLLVSHLRCKPVGFHHVRACIRVERDAPPRRRYQACSKRIKSDESGEAHCTVRHETSPTTPLCPVAARLSVHHPACPK